MHRIVVLASGWSLVLIAVVGCVDTAGHHQIAAAVLFGLLAVGVAALTTGEDRRRGVVLRRDLQTWVEQTSAATGQNPDELASQAVSRLRNDLSSGTADR